MVAEHAQLVNDRLWRQLLKSPGGNELREVVVLGIVPLACHALFWLLLLVLLLPLLFFHFHLLSLEPMLQILWYSSVLFSLDFCAPSFVMPLTYSVGPRAPSPWASAPHGRAAVWLRETDSRRPTRSISGRATPGCTSTCVPCIGGTKTAFAQRRRPW